MRRGYWIALAVTLLGMLGLWLAARLEKSPIGREKDHGRVPTVVAGRDRADVREDDGEREAFQPTQDAAIVRCSYEGEGDPGTLTAMGTDVVTGDRGGTELSLRLPEGRWTVMWQNVHGTVALGPMEVEGGEIETCTLSDEGWKVSGVVRNLQGTPLDLVQVQACGHRVETDEDGRFSAWSRSRSCTVYASWRDGVLTRRSEEVEATAFDGGIELAVDDAPVAGMGINFKMSREGALVRAVTPDSPAEGAGVERGDRILSVNGTSVAGLTDSEFIAIGTGREGSSVRLELERDGETRTVSFTRRRLEARDTGR